MSAQPCRCLLRDLGPGSQEHERVIHFYENLSPALRVAEEEYAQRLKKCLACRHLQNGTCMQCGCYVEVRAAQKKTRCPLKTW